MAKVFSITALILNTVFDLLKAVGDIVHVSALKTALTQISNGTEAYNQISRSIMSGYAEILICSVLAVLSVTACILLLRSKQDKNQQNVL